MMTASKTQSQRRYRRAFSAFEPTRDFATEVRREAATRERRSGTKRRTARALPRLVTSAAVAAVACVALTGIAYAADVGGVRQVVAELMRGGGVTDFVREQDGSAEPTGSERLANGGYRLTYRRKDGATEALTAVGRTVDPLTGIQRPLTRAETMQAVRTILARDGDGFTWLDYYDLADKVSSGGRIPAHSSAPSAGVLATSTWLGPEAMSYPYALVDMGEPTAYPVEFTWMVYYGFGDDGDPLLTDASLDTLESGKVYVEFWEPVDAFLPLAPDGYEFSGWTIGTEPGEGAGDMEDQMLTALLASIDPVLDVTLYREGDHQPMRFQLTKQDGAFRVTYASDGAVSVGSRSGWSAFASGEPTFPLPDSR